MAKRKNDLIPRNKSSSGRPAWFKSINGNTGDYSRGAAGFWVENGEIQFPVQEVTIAGNLRDMFRQIVAVGCDTETRSSIHTGSVLIERMKVAGQ